MNTYRAEIMARHAHAIAAVSFLCAAGVLFAGPTATTKEETVFAVLTAGGEVKNVIVSDWLHASVAGVQLRDRSILANVKNVQGTETPRMIDGLLQWKPVGKDIFYQGTTTKKLPLSVSVTYTLEGKPIAVSELAGKSGVVKITVHVKNEDAHVTADQDGTHTLYTPLMAAVIVALPSSVFSGIGVSSNGALVADGQSNIAVGVMLPGLAESVPMNVETAKALQELGLPSFALPEEFSVTANATGFRLGSIIVTATPQLPDLGFSDAARGKLGDLKSSLAQFQVAARSLADGAGALSTGATRLSDGIHSAAAQLSDRAAANTALLADTSSFVMSDENIAAARALMADGQVIQGFDLSLLDLIPQILNPQTQALLKKTLEDAKQADIPALMKMPFAGLVLTDENLKNISQALGESDAFYSGVDARRLEKARAFADTAASFVMTTKLMADSAESIQWSTIQGLSSGAIDQERSAAAAFASATTAIAVPADRAALLDRLAKGSALSDADRTALTALVRASAARRDEDTALDPQLVSVSKAAAYVTNDLAPRLRQSSVAAAQAAPSIAAATALLDAGTVSYIDAFVPRVQQLKAVHDRNAITYRLADGVLMLASGNGGLSASIAKIDALQRDLAALQPVMESVAARLPPDLLTRLGDGSALLAQVKSMRNDLDRNEDLMKLGGELLEERNVQTERALVSSLPQLTDGVCRMDEGAAALAKGLQQLSEGATRFTAEGVAPLCTQVGGVVNVVDAGLGVAGKLLDLSRSYKSFSGIDASMTGNVKFIMRTEEVKN